MPIYAYKCTDCGHEQDVLQKISEPPLKYCPSCGHAAMAKQVTAAGFQLKGSGWYATDFRNKDAGGKDPKTDGKTEKGDKTDQTEKGDKSDKSANDSAAPAAAPVAAAAPAPAPAASGAASGSSSGSGG